MRGLNGVEAQRLGKDTEQAVLCCAEFKPVASWIHALRAGTSEEDAQGIDIVAETEWGEVQLQVKSGMKRARQFTKDHPDIPVIVVYPNDSEERIRNRVRNLVKQKLQSLGQWPEKEGNKQG